MTNIAGIITFLHKTPHIFDTYFAKIIIESIPYYLHTIYRNGSMVVNPVFLAVYTPACYD